MVGLGRIRHRLRRVYQCVADLRYRETLDLVAMNPPSVKELLTVAVSFVAAMVVVVIGVALLEWSRPFWLQLPAWAPIIPLAFHAGITLGIACQVYFFVLRRFASNA